MHMQHNQVADINPSTAYKLHNLYKEGKLALPILDRYVCFFEGNEDNILPGVIICFVNSQKHVDLTRILGRLADKRVSSMNRNEKIKCKKET